MDSIALAFIATVVLTLYHLAFGIAEAVILSDTADAKDECGAAVWYNILVLCVIHFLTGVSTPCAFLQSVSADSDDAKSEKTGTLVTLGLAIWSCVIYFDTSDECKDRFQDTYPRLWDCVEGEVFAFFVSIGLVALLFVAAFIVMCYHCCCADQQAPARRAFLGRA